MAKVIRVVRIYEDEYGHHGKDNSKVWGYHITYTLGGRGNRHHYATVFAKDELDAYRRGNAIVQRELEKPNKC